MKTVYTIPPDVAFVDALAEGLVKEAGNDPLIFSDYLILLPTRRSCLHLREAFRKRMNGRAALLPRMQPLADPDEDEFYFFAETEHTASIPPAISPLRRQLLLAQAVLSKDNSVTIDQAMKLAEALASLLDEVQTERRDLSVLSELVLAEDLAKHWQETVAFLDILTHVWPSVLEAEGAIDPVDRRNRVLSAQAETWRRYAPPGRIIAAGSTGSLLATAELLEVIAELPRGSVILPGLDQDLPAEAWDAVNESHPQYGLKELLSRFGIERSVVQPWHEIKSVRPARVRLLQETMRPSEVSDEWRNLTPAMIPPGATEGLTRLSLDHSQDEARVIALIMRQALEIPGKTTTLVTPDRALAERVSVLLDRWHIRVNDSGGTPLASLPTGIFLIDVLRASSPKAKPVTILSLLKHPLTALSMVPADCRALARQIELDLWRHPTESTCPTRAESEKALQAFDDLLSDLKTSWDQPRPLSERLTMHRQIAERVAMTDVETGAARLWRGEEGEAAANWLDDWHTAAQGFPFLTGSDYLAVFEDLARGVVIRSSWGLHPRLSILGPLEARLIQSDLIILGAFNEGHWPPDAKIDPWMSRPMKRKFGLPLPERRIGLSAHDFVQLGSSPEVILTRAERADGAPSVPSRFLLQLETVLRALKYLSPTDDPLRSDNPFNEWTRLLDEPKGGIITPCQAPEPKPSVDKRVRQLSVTEIGTWQQNPYAIYAKHILGLRKLESLETNVDASDRGQLIHRALEDFVTRFPNDLPESPLDDLLDLGRVRFADFKDHPEVMAFWWPRFENIARWFIEEEIKRRESGVSPIYAELKGKLALKDFILTGRVDRVETQIDSTFNIIDYKTGSVPPIKAVTAGVEPQLPLLALMTQKGAFKKLGTGAVSQIAYWSLNGGRSGSDETRCDKDNIDALVSEAEKGLLSLIALFNEADTPFRAVPNPALQPRFDDYAHLARLSEWGRTEEDQ